MRSGEGNHTGSGSRAVRPIWLLPSWRSCTAGRGFELPAPCSLPAGCSRSESISTRASHMQPTAIQPAPPAGQVARAHFGRPVGALHHRRRPAPMMRHARSHRPRCGAPRLRSSGSLTRSRPHRRHQPRNTASEANRRCGSPTRISGHSALDSDVGQPSSAGIPTRRCQDHGQRAWSAARADGALSPTERQDEQEFRL